jgi:hypothetical protein
VLDGSSTPSHRMSWPMSLAWRPRLKSGPPSIATLLPSPRHAFSSFVPRSMTPARVISPQISILQR